MMTSRPSQRAANEITHGKRLSLAHAEAVWGWGTRAGQLRADRRARVIAEGALLGPGVHALEVGCGTGLFTETFARSGAQVIAVDISPELLAQARARGINQDQVQFLERRFEDCEVDGPFDAVIGSSVLHHLDIVPALTRMWELLRPGGVLSFAEPNMLNPQIAVQKNIPWIKDLLGDSPDETAFVRWQLSGLLTRIGFNDVQILPFDWLHPATPERLIGVVSSTGGLIERIPILREFAGSLYIRAVRPPAP